MLATTHPVVRARSQTVRRGIRIGIVIVRLVRKVRRVRKVRWVREVRLVRAVREVRAAAWCVLIARIVTIARRYQDLICWQLADELEQLVFERTATGPASRDFKLRDQIRDSSSSTTRNIAEGFGRYWPSEFSGFLTVARGSLMETHNSAGAGLRKGYFSAEDAERMQRLALRATRATTRLIQYLDSLPRGRKR